LVLANSSKGGSKGNATGTSYGDLPVRDSNANFPQAKETVEGATPFSKIPFDKEKFGKLQDWLIDFSELKFQGDLGRGAFGIVYRGNWRNQECAIKKLLITGTFSETKTKEFYDEAMLMCKLRPHVNVTTFLGLSVPPNLCIVTEFYENGSLYALLHSKKIIEKNTISKCIKGIASGMSHLHREGIIHRDLAARNVLLSGTFEPKIADFGLSRILQSDDPNSAAKTNADTGPLKHLAPECLLRHEYSNKSDVWSYGIVIFEILTRQEPYPGLTPVVAATKVSHGLKLELPQKAVADWPEFAPLMVQCLQFEVEARPTFNEICEKFFS